MTGPTIIEAPMWLLVPGGILAWLCYFGIVLSERRRDRLTNHDEQRTEHDHDDEHGEEDPHDDVGDDHARSIARGPVALPPGIPSIVERLDRWTA